MHIICIHGAGAPAPDVNGVLQVGGGSHPLVKWSKVRDYPKTSRMQNNLHFKVHIALITNSNGHSLLTYLDIVC